MFIKEQFRLAHRRTEQAPLEVSSDGLCVAPDCPKEVGPHQPKQGVGAAQRVARRDLEEEDVVKDRLDYSQPSIARASSHEEAGPL